MDKYYNTTIDQRGVAYLTINRPEKRNAFDASLIIDLLSQIEALNENDKVRIIVLSGEGDTFSSGADLNWMKAMAAFDEETNRDDSLNLAELMFQLNAVEKPTIARINGDAFGGAIGLIACCDIAIAVRESRFSFSEVKLGIIPAVISPYIIEAIGLRQAKKVFLTGEKISALEAVRLGLVHDCVARCDLGATVDKYIRQLLRGGSIAQKEIKQLINDCSDITPDVKENTAKIISRLRVSPEGQEGIGAFLEKRRPAWCDTD